MTSTNVGATPQSTGSTQSSISNTLNNNDNTSSSTSSSSTTSSSLISWSMTSSSSSSNMSNFAHTNTNNTKTSKKSKSAANIAAPTTAINENGAVKRKYNTANSKSAKLLPSSSGTGPPLVDPFKSSLPLNIANNVESNSTNCSTQAWVMQKIYFKVFNAFTLALKVEHFQKLMLIQCQNCINLIQIMK